ncbi:hypothetical protein DNJ73_05350 [Prochlorococcus marinus XMU1408]|uniref:Uncharacterized protein n=1 Tax=Prochlorococcus marinus XMU1408 TaxID=2213228 RepID=A0A318R4U4_PROMR|nr:hypothetical protein [Prochlorococcus marinus str. XMU1408]PYE03164.1 hypothetical protein DNJ73_05350 [Prochlorococcus marinus XMU1408]
MLIILSYIRYSNASLKIDTYFLFGAIIFFLICGILIFQNQIWEEEEFSRNRKWLKWKADAIKENKADLSSIYPCSKK